MPRLSREHRFRQIKQACLDVAARDGLYTLTYTSIAAHCACTRSLVRHYAPSQRALRELALDRAVEIEHIGVVLQGVATSDPCVAGISAAFRDKIVSFVVGAL